MAVFVGGAVSGADLGVHAALSAAVLTAGVTLGGVAEESGASAVVVLVTTAIAVPNTVPPWPFDEAAERWKDLANELHAFRSDLSNLVNHRSGLRDCWEGPGADAFCGYVNRKLLPAVEDLARCAEGVSSSCAQVSSNLMQGISIYFGKILAGIILCIVSNSLRALPVVGAFLCAMAKWAIVESWIIGLTYDAYDMYASFKTLEAEQTRMKDYQKRLADLLDVDGKNLDRAALGQQLRQVESAIENTRSWNKS